MSIMQYKNYVIKTAKYSLLFNILKNKWKPEFCIHRQL